MSTPFEEEGLAASEMSDGSTVFPFEDQECDWSEVPDKLTIDAGLATLEIKEVSRIMSKAKPEEGKAAKAMIVVKSTVIEPTPSSGMQFTHYLVIGSEEDPEAKQRETKMKRGGAVDFRNLIVSAKIPLKNYKDSELFQLLKGCRYVTNITIEKDGRNGSKGFYPIGTDARAAGVKPSVASRVVRSIAASSAPSAVLIQAKVACPVCDTPVNRSEYGSHLQAHEADRIASDTAEVPA